MHLIAAYQIANAYSIDRKTEMLAGALAPDAVSSKDTTHYYIGKHEDYSRTMDLQRFVTEHKSELSSPFWLGYYSHLIADHIWLQGFYFSWLRNRMENDPQFYTVYHEDFRLLNGKLLKHFGLKEELEASLQAFCSFPEMKEINKADVSSFLDSAVEDLHYSQEDLNAPLQVFTMPQIIGYICTSVDKSLVLMNRLSGLEGGRL